jgi:outer membrane protein assembly factor BamB
MSEHTMLSRILPIGLLAFSLTACGLLGGTDNAEPPAPLAQFTPSLAPRLLWSADTGSNTRAGHLRLAPVVDAGRVFVASPKGMVRAYDLESGQSLWQTDTRAVLSGGPGAGAGLVLIGGKDGEILALAQEDGAEKWRARVSSEVLAAPRIGGGLVAVRTVDGKVFGLNSSDGTLRWVYERGVPVLSLRGTSAPLMLGDAVLAGLDNGKVAALALDNGKLLFELPVAQPSGRTELERMVDIDADLQVYAGILFVTSYQGRTAALDLRAGEALWQRETSSYSGFDLDHKALYLSDADSAIWAFDQRNGASLWKQASLRARRVTAPARVGDYLVVGDLDGYLHWLSRDSGEFAARVETLKGSPILAPPVAVGEKRVLALNSSGRLALFTVEPAVAEASGGEKIEFGSSGLIRPLGR